MRKLILLLLLITASLKVQAQFCGEAKGDQPSSEIKTNFYFDIDDKGNPIKVPIYKWMDRFGNRYADLQIKSKRDETSKSVPTFGFTNPDCQSQGGLFNVYVEDIQNATGTGFDLTANSQMLTVICQVFDDLDVLLNQQASTCAGVTKSGVNIRLRSFNDPSSGVLGSASSFYETEGELNGIKHGEVWKAINTGYNEDNTWDGFININLGYSNWYSGFGTTPAGQVDLYTVMLHEVLHSLGFASLINSNGDSKFQSNGIDSYSPYDTFLTSDNGTELIINTAGYDWDFNPANPISVLTSGCGVSGPNVEFRGNFNAPLSPVHAAASWSGGSSISHFESNCDSYGNTANYVMNPGIATGVSSSLTQEEINTLGDLGYQLNSVYGTNTLANSSANPRQHSNFTSPNVTSLVATDDYGPCCNGTYTVENCTGNSLNILVSDLLCNDVYSNANVTLVEDLTNNVALPITGGAITYTPNGSGTHTLRYLLEDSNGNQSNYAYIYISVLPCPTFNCDYTDSCNLICNPHFEDFGNNMDDIGGVFTMHHLNAGNPPDGPNGWYTFLGSPSYYDFNIPCTGTACGNINYGALPGDPGGAIALYGCTPTQNGSSGESVLTRVEIEPNTDYILSLSSKPWFIGNNMGLRVYLSDAAAVVSNPYSSNTCGLPAFEMNTYLNSSPVLQIAEFGPTTDLNWQQSLSCFSTDSQLYETLILMAYDEHAFVDNVELVKDRLQDINKEYELNCQETITIGENLCSITNLQYSWWDVTDTGNPIQLTQGTTILNGNVSIPSGSNGSELEITAAESTTFELRRTFVSTNGITIANNNCNASVQVQVNVNLDVTLTKEVIGDSTAGIGAPVTYQITVTNNTGYPINNLDITDVLAANFNVGTLNVNTNANVTSSNAGNTVTFTVLNLADGASEQIVFDVVVNGTIGETVINCASLEYLDCPLESCVPIELIECITQTPVITADGNDITTDLTYTIPCGETCVTLQATTITNAVYNTSNPVLTNLNGLFCLTSNNTLTSFTATITGLDSCGNDYSQNITINIEQDCCADEPYIEPYWDFCASNNVCELDDFPIRVLDDDGTPLVAIDGYTFLWTDSDGNTLGTSSALFGAMADTEYTLTVTYPDGCVYTITYIKECCTDDISVSVYDCSNNPPLNNQESINSVVKYEDLVNAMEYYNSSSENKEDCDPCDAPIPVVYISILSNGSLITNYQSIVISWDTNPTGYTITDPTQPLAIYTDVLYTITVTVLDPEGHTCIYTYDYIYECEPDCETTAPTNLQVSGTTLTWDPVPGATSYIITSPAGNVPQIDCDCDKGTGISLAPVTVNTNNYTLPASLADNCFVWQVTAICESGDKSPISEQACYKPKEEECEVTAPTNLQVSGTTLSWNPVPGAIAYIISSPAGNVPQIDCGCDGSNGISIAPVTVNTNSYTLPASLSDKCFVWQVTAICKSEKKSPISKQACYTPKEEKCEVTAPTNLQVVGSTLTWNPVPGAIAYIVSSPGGGIKIIDCGCNKYNGVSIAPVTVNTNSYALPSSLKESCFVWQVTAICKSKEKSPISKQACYNGPKKGEKDIVSIYPNPNKGNMNIKIDTENDSNITLNVYKFDGTLIKTINNLKTESGHLDFNLNLQSRLNSGLYFFIFNIGDNTLSKKVIIE